MYNIKPIGLGGERTQAQEASRMAISCKHVTCIISKVCNINQFKQ
jgi:hypothetical protein